MANCSYGALASWVFCCKSMNMSGAECKGKADNKITFRG